MTAEELVVALEEGPRLGAWQGHSKTLAVGGFVSGRCVV
jgi:hypothetical protein